MKEHWRGVAWICSHCKVIYVQLSEKTWSALLDYPLVILAIVAIELQERWEWRHQRRRW